MNTWRRLAPAGLRSGAVLVVAAALIVVGSGSSRAQTTLEQQPPLGETVTPANSYPFTDNLAVSPDDGSVTYMTVSPPADNAFQVSSTGEISTSATLSTGQYVASGTDSDDEGDSGSWSYTLTVSSLTQSSDTSNGSTTVTPFDTLTFDEQLAVTGSVGTVTYTMSSSTGPDGTSGPLLQVSTDGLITATGELPVGSYTIQGDDSDTNGDTGSWIYTLTVTGATLSQGLPFSSSGLTPYDYSAYGFSTQLTPTAYEGAAVSYVSGGTTSPPGASAQLQVSPSGIVTLSGTPVASTTPYTVSGTDSDIYGDSGTWNYSLTVTPGIISADPSTESATVTALDSPDFTGQIGVSGGVGELSFSENAGSGVEVDGTGEVKPGQLAVGTYTAGGDVEDPYGDAGTWTYSLDVTPGTLLQSTPLQNNFSVTPATSKSFTDSLEVAAAAGTTDYTESTGAPSITVASDGAISVPSSLAAGTHKASGSDSDTDGDTGTWTYSLVVSPGKVTQAAPSSNATTPAASSKFKQQLAVSSALGAVKFVTTTTKFPPNAKTSLKVSGSGLVTSSGPLAVGTYKASGTDTDAYGDTGTWTYTLDVSPTAITQAKPFKNTAAVTTARSSKFVAQLTTTGGDGPVSFVTTSKKAPVGAKTTIRVSSTGAVSTTGALKAGTYTVSGTDSDTHKDSGTWSFTLTVSAMKLSQLSPTAARTPTGQKYSGQLAVAAAAGPVAYKQVSGTPEIKVAATGAVSAAGNLKAGTYKASGTDSDALGDSGTWSYTLTVDATTITQSAPQTGSVRQGKAFSAQLAVSGTHGAVTFTQTKGAPALTVSFSGRISAAGRLAKGTYRASGTESDALGDTGTWTFSLTVTGQILTQLHPTGAGTLTGRAFTGRLRVSGSHGAVTFAETTGAPYLQVSTSGVISAPDDLRAGTYRAAGSTRDAQDDTGTWTFVLTVSATRITQLAPFGASAPVRAAFTARLKVAGAHGTVSFTKTAGPAGLKVSSTGAVSAATNLSPGHYDVSGRDVDSLGDTGGWSFALTVTTRALSQAAPDSAKTVAGHVFKGQLNVSGAYGALTYTQTTGAPDIAVSSSGAIAAPPTLTPGSYSASGRVTDSVGDSGTWTFKLTVVPGGLVQSAPSGATVSVGSAFIGQLKVSGAKGKVTWTEKSGAPHIKVSSSGAVTAPKTLAKGTYKASGTDRDALGDTGAWTFTLTVKPTTIRHRNGKLVQIAPTAGRIVSGNVFTAQLKVSGAHGTLVFTQLTGAEAMTVSSTGLVTARSTLAPATYVITGTVKDSAGDTGTWSFTLFVEPA